jgi:hypothetical protein
MDTQKLERKGIGTSIKTKSGYTVFACEHGGAWYKSGEEVFGTDKCDGSKLYALVSNENDGDCIECGASKGEIHIWPCTRELCPHCGIRARIGCINKINRELMDLLLEMREVRTEIRLDRRKRAKPIYSLEF